MSPKLIASISVGAVSAGGAFYFYNLPAIDSKETIITKDDIEIETTTTSSEHQSGIACNQTRTIKIEKLKNTKYYLCDSVGDTNTNHTQITKASMVFPKNITFATEAGSRHTIIEWKEKQDITNTPSFYGFNTNPYVSTVNKATFFIHSPNSMSDEDIKDMIVKISGFKNEHNHTPTYKKLQKHLELSNKRGGDGGNIEIKNDNITVGSGGAQQIAEMITELKKAYTHAAVIIPKLELWISKKQELSKNQQTEPIVILQTRINQLNAIITDSTQPSTLNETEKTRLIDRHRELKTFIEKGRDMETDAQIFIKQMDELGKTIKQYKDTQKVVTTPTN